MRRYSQVRYMPCLNCYIYILSQFVELQRSLKDSFPLPPKHSFASTIRVSNRIKDSVISERKAGLSAYLSFLLNIPEYREHDVLKQFLSPLFETNAAGKSPQMVYLNKAVLGTGVCPLTIATRQIVASYYPSWCVDDRPPESLDFSKFDILFFGALSLYLKPLSNTWSSLCYSEFFLFSSFGRR